MAEFRFSREDIYELVEQMQLPDEIAIYNGFRGSFGTCIMLVSQAL